MAYILDESKTPDMIATGRISNEVIGSNFSSVPGSPTVLLPRALGM
jgi:hypothetical protein